MKDNQKKYLVLIFASFVALAVLWLLFLKPPTHLTTSIEANQGDFIIQNIDQGAIEVSQRKLNSIEINLTGPADELRRLRFGKIENGSIELSLPQDSKGIKGSIIVPDTLNIINLDLPPPSKKINTNNLIPNKTSQLFGKTLESEFKNPLRLGGGGNSINPTIPSDNAPILAADDNPSAPSSSSNNSESDTNTNSTTPSNETSAPQGTENPPSDPAPNPLPNPQPDPLNLAFCGDSIVNQISETCDDGNTTSGDGCSSNCLAEIAPALCGNSIVEESEECDDGNDIDDDYCSNQCVIDVYQKFIGEKCTLELQQQDRNTCCQVNFENEPHDSCLGKWIFDYHSRLCAWSCPEENCESKINATEKNNCCVNKNNAAPTPPCNGQWIFTNDKQQCEYQCLNYLEVTDRRPLAEINQVSQYCTYTFDDNLNQNQCCDDLLKHPLSIGPKKGYPDCVGQWQILPGGNQCEFQCVSHENMIEILKEINLRKIDEN